MATANFNKVFESGQPLAAAELNDLVENTKENKNNIDKKVDKETNEVQTINGGLNIGGTPSTASAKGRVMITGHTNPLIGLQAIDNEGQQLDPYYFQVANNIMFLGPTSSKALSFDRDGNVNIPTSLTVAGNSIATLDENGRIPTAQLPSYVDDVLEYDTKENFPSPGETNKIYIDLETNLTWRWGGSQYVEISPSLALGTTASTAFAGDQGEIALTRANIALTHANTALNHADAKGIAVANGLYKISTNAEGHVSEANAVTKEDITKLGIPSLPETNPNGTEGDFAISDGAGGITWQTIPLAANETF